MKRKLAAITLDHDSYIALHAQLHNAIQQLIVSGRWQIGERIPGEQQFAAHLNVSRSTVRIALQRAEVEGLIRREAGRGTFVAYDPGTRTEKRFVGYVTRSFHNEIHRILLSSVETMLRSEGYQVIFSNARRKEDEVQVLDRLRDDDDVSGLIVWPNAHRTPDQLASLRAYPQSGLPIVFVDRKIDGVVADYVGADHYGGTVALMRHLIELGHRRIAYLTHDVEGLYPVAERVRAYRETVAEVGLADYDLWKMHSPHGTEFFETDLVRLLDEHPVDFNAQIIALMKQATPRPTAIVCVNDALAILAIRALQSAGYRVPEDVSVVGFDDISLAAHMNVPLTTVAQDAHRIGEVAARTLLERLDGVSASPQQHVVPTRLQIRMSATTPIDEEQSDPSALIRRDD